MSLELFGKSWSLWYYRIAGKFGEVFNWRVCMWKIAKLKTAKHCDTALCICDQYWSSPNLKLVNICSEDGFVKFNACQIFPLYGMSRVSVSLRERWARIHPDTLTLPYPLNPPPTHTHIHIHTDTHTHTHKRKYTVILITWGYPQAMCLWASRRF